MLQEETISPSSQPQPEEEEDTGCLSKEEEKDLYASLKVVLTAVMNEDHPHYDPSSTRHTNFWHNCCIVA